MQYFLYRAALAFTDTFFHGLIASAPFLLKYLSYVCSHAFPCFFLLDIKSASWMETTSRIFLGVSNTWHISSEELLRKCWFWNVNPLSPLSLRLHLLSSQTHWEGRMSGSLRILFILMQRSGLNSFDERWTYYLILPDSPFWWLHLSRSLCAWYLYSVLMPLFLFPLVLTWYKTQMPPERGAETFLPNCSWNISLGTGHAKWMLGEAVNVLTNHPV